ncbi:MAG: hypothetical protein SVU32_01315, partial [Candidatus Nanohaloarchaea archaeon]|nr:hypothetical protein [Candidatus Nanohaloarchaea archaeon]
PRIASLSIPNGSAVRKEEYLNATFTDQQDAGIFAIWGSILGTGMNSSLIRDQNYIRQQFFKNRSQGFWYRFRGWSN